VSVSVEFGRLGAPAYALLCRVSDVAADGGGVSKAAFFKRVLQEMVAQASGRAFLGRLPVPVAEVVGLGKSRVSAVCIP
jgi:hypothetical protein